MEDERILTLRALGAQIGRGVFFGPDVYIEHHFAPLLKIEDGAVLARGVCVLLHDSGLNNVAGAPLQFGKVILRRNCYIGANTTVLCGVEIGEGALVGAAALVTRDVPAGAVAYGHPARVRGSVAELAERHRQGPDGGRRLLYLDLPAWRDRRTPEDTARAAARIDALLRGISWDEEEA
jgi:acetyltransferase-like isoleucine patch superfamily enzyme